MSFDISHAQGELIAQIRPGVATPVEAFSADQLRIEVTLILCTLDPAGVASLDAAIYHDDDGTTYDLDSIIISETRTNLTQHNVLFQAQHPGSGITIKPGGSLGVQSSVADDCNFSIYGIAETRAERVVGR